SPRAAARCSTALVDKGSRFDHARAQGIGGYTRLVSVAVEDESSERPLNMHVDPEHLGGVYSNFANISFSDYEFTLTFARIDHEVEEGDVPGVVVARVNMSTRFMKELL